MWWEWPTVYDGCSAVLGRGEGKRGGYRFILFFRQGERLFFEYAYPKSKLANISGMDLVQYKRGAKFTLSLTDKQLEKALMVGEFKEIEGYEET
ncbi:hypothetical protein FACS189462_0940 [Spirochaetia bacterium]|nr:hypothetical protein FACS189462_0940 [Spirochaetia bacterium]